MSNIAIIGAGIIGLTCAEELLRHGHKVTIFYNEPLRASTSCKAGAIWYPYKVEADDDALNWVTETFNVLNDRFEKNEAGYFQTDLHQYFDEKPLRETWMSILKDFQMYDANDTTLNFDLKGLPFATKMNVPLVDAFLVMDNLVKAMKAQDVVFQFCHIENIETDARLENFDTIINCSGLGAQTLVCDETLKSGRGQVLLMANPDLKHSSVYVKSDDELCYILPRGDYCVVGGCCQMGSHETVIDDNLTQDILERAYQFEPSLKTQAILDIKVGFRPVRPTIRLEKEMMGDRTVIHNYGHGGAGWSFAWGCAKKVAKVLRN